MKNNIKTFRTRVSVLLLAIIIASFLPIFIPMMTQGVTGGLWIVVVLFVVMVYMITNIKYAISDSTLIIRTFSINNTRIEISNISSITRSYNPLSSPASSLKRLRINYNHNLKNTYTLISPVREQEFIDTLKSINPNIEIDVPDTKGKWRIQDWDI